MASLLRAKHIQAQTVAQTDWLHHLFLSVMIFFYYIRAHFFFDKSLMQLPY